ncbi:hypothetical protein AXG93_2534s1000 [Marchantia polymorpha subsp. ruderalis]|uniref:Uncharacterized protein n=1 Tax=Marchantia polymorpha subsp. ruderalis TaxID=1480154 RepID=A0A176W767_MARPO|nr:hypothetical protein AXG93_2534s1000 [Marchantia polymorpha subsp. ruderalis]
MSEDISSLTYEYAVEEENLRTPKCGSSELQCEEPLRSLEKADVPESKTNEEHAKELTLGQDILEHVVEQIGETVVESPKIPSPQMSSGMTKPKVEKRYLLPTQ